MRRYSILLAGAMAVASPAPAAAQPAARADVSGIVGWFNAHKPNPTGYDDWYNQSAYAGAGLGWYWTEHLKTEVEFGATSRAELYSVDRVEIDGQSRYLSSERSFSTRRFTAGQQYQFFRNAWVHPHLAAGVDLTWETTSRRDDPIFIFDQASGASRALRPALTTGPARDFVIRPFAELGTKLYLSRRAFFRTDLRLTIRDGVDEAIVRFGFGADF